MTINFKGTEYELATTLRVAYKLQGQHNHKSYLAIFDELGQMTIEDQIGIIYASFAVGNPEESKFITKQAFLDYVLDNMDLSYVMDTIQKIIEGVMGKELTEKATAEAVENENENENFQK